MVPAVPVLRPAELLKLSPRDIATKLRVLLIVTVGLFGLMHLLAGIVFVLDERDMARRFRSLCAKFGHVTHPGGAWTWHFGQEERFAAGASIGLVSGGVVELCRELGLPYVRLRMAIPEEIFTGDIAHAVGRERDLAPRTLAEAQPEEAEKVLLLTDTSVADRAARQERTIALARKLLDTNAREYVAGSIAGVGAGAGGSAKGSLRTVGATPSRRLAAPGSERNSRRGISFDIQALDGAAIAAAAAAAVASGSGRASSSRSSRRGTGTLDSGGSARIVVKSLENAADLILHAQRLDAAGGRVPPKAPAGDAPSSVMVTFRAKVERMVAAKRAGEKAVADAAAAAAAVRNDSAAGPLVTARSKSGSDPEGRRYGAGKAVSTSTTPRGVPAVTSSVASGLSGRGKSLANMVDGDGTDAARGASNGAVKARMNSSSPSKRSSKFTIVTPVKLPSDELAAMAAASKPSPSAGRLVIFKPDAADEKASPAGRLAPPKKGTLDKPSTSRSRSSLDVSNSVSARKRSARAVSVAATPDDAQQGSLDVARVTAELEVTADDVRQSVINRQVSMITAPPSVAGLRSEVSGAGACAPLILAVASTAHARGPLISPSQ